MTDSELLIKIRTALEAGGLDQAKQKLDAITGATNKASGAAAEQGAALSASQKEMLKSAQALMAIRAAAEGNIGATIKLIAQTEGLGMSLAKLIPVVGAFWAGWKGGLKIGEFSWGKIFDLQGFDKTTKSIRDQISSVIKDLKDLNGVKMTKLHEELEKIETGMEKVREKTQLEQERETALMTARQEVDKAKLEEKYAGPDKEKNFQEYEREKAALEKRHADEQRALKIKQLNDSDRELSDHEKQINEKLSKARQEESKKKEEAELKSYYAGALGGKKAIKAAQVAKAEAEIATKNREELEKTEEPKLRRIKAERYRGETAREVMHIGSYASEAELSAAGKTTDVKQQEAMKKDVRSMREQAIDRAEADAKALKKDLDAEHEKKKAALEREAEDASLESSIARRQADVYKPKEKARGKELKRQKDWDVELDVSAVAAESREAALKAKLKELDREYSRAVKALADFVDNTREQNKNLPL